MEDAKRRLDALHKVVAEIKLRTTSDALRDGAYTRAVNAAAGAYLQAVAEFMAATTIDDVPQPACDGQSLTPRERCVLALVASGKSSKEIAGELGISFKTVTTHRYKLQKKLNAHHTADLTRIAIRMGLAQP